MHLPGGQVGHLLSHQQTCQGIIQLQLINYHCHISLRKIQHFETRPKNNIQIIESLDKMSNGNMNHLKPTLSNLNIIKTLTKLTKLTRLANFTLHQILKATNRNLNTRKQIANITRTPRRETTLPYHHPANFQPTEPRQ
ncbi:Protein of unknown function [Pyronema omphalodes CBS 100304]|uniref:Uncharacterized protein n=1 Tax=Pyronema omphalodes (strain CBS 100304) TaxID=1076935 RepID=U4LE51_PYROM|nr:Protein of unknown function [Pyronema omphalodes CBS 100304]